MMKNKSVKSIYLMVMFVIVLSLTGCWSADEINNLATINVMGIDVNDTGQVEVTAVIAKPHTLFSETAVDGNDQGKFLIETTSGKSLYEAIGDLSGSVTETLYFGHLDAIVFGEQAAREGMVSHLDFFKRANNFRPNIQLLVTRGPAKELVKTKPQLNATLGMELKNLSTSNRFATTGMVNDISQFMKTLSSNTTDSYTGMISSAEEQGIDVGKKEKETNNPPDPQKNDVNTKGNSVEKDQKRIPQELSLQGTAVFKNDQLKGYLNEKETRGLLWIQGELQNEIVVLTCGANKEGTVSMVINDSESQLSPRISSGTPQMTVNIQVEAEIGQLTCPGFNVNTNQIDQLNQQLADMVEQETSSVLAKAKNQWQTDIFGFGQAIYRNDPKEWNQMAPQWRNGMLKEMEMDVNVSANISRYGMLKDPTQANEAE